MAVVVEHAIVVNVAVVLSGTGREAGAGGVLDAVTQHAHHLAAVQPLGTLVVVELLISRLMVAADVPGYLLEQNFA